MEYLHNLLRHLQVIKKWCRANSATLAVDADSLVVSIDLQGRKVRLLPKFLLRINATQAAYVVDPPVERGRFAGWLPYSMKRWDIGSDKLTFKAYCQNLGLRTPRLWGRDEQPSADHIVKLRKGSFGRDILGPYRAGEQLGTPLGHDAFKEEFISGVAFKIWYWDSTPVALVAVPPPTLVADGVRTISQIAGQVRGNFDVSYDLETAATMLKWQGYTGQSVPPPGTVVTLDFLYGHKYLRMTIDDPDCLQTLSPRLKMEAAHVGRLLHSAIPEPIRSNTSYTVDAVMDAEEQLWLLEMNCHPVTHPNAYEPMLNAWRSGFGYR